MLEQESRVVVVGKPSISDEEAHNQPNQLELWLQLLFEKRIPGWLGITERYYSPDGKPKEDDCLEPIEEMG